MQLAELWQRAMPPEPWREGDNIPWSEPTFSARMLAEHLSQAHDAASRRGSTIDRQVAWIHGTLLGGSPTRILDLGCGPGLYTSRLARLGHSCVGSTSARRRSRMPARLPPKSSSTATTGWRTYAAPPSVAASGW